MEQANYELGKNKGSNIRYQDGALIYTVPSINDEEKQERFNAFTEIPQALENFMNIVSRSLTNGYIRMIAKDVLDIFVPDKLKGTEPYATYYTSIGSQENTEF